MNEYVKGLWLKALRSGKYDQGTGRLKSTEIDFGGQENDYFCCLGVLCEIHRQEVAGEWGDVNGFGLGYIADRNYAHIKDAAIYELPFTVQKWAALDSGDPFVDTEDGRFELSALNDAFKPFNKIADAIENSL